MKPAKKGFALTKEANRQHLIEDKISIWEEGEEDEMIYEISCILLK